jgi:DNA-binding MurR/RpiR family transcriptional regulator
VDDARTEAVGASEGPSGGSLASLFSQHHLSPAQLRIAQVILESPVEALFLSGSLLARRAGVSQPSVTRFARALGYDHVDTMFSDFRHRVLQDELGTQDMNRFQVLVAQEAQNLNAIHRAFSESVRVRFLADQLVSQPAIPVYATGNARPVALYFVESCRRFYPEVSLVEGQVRDRAQSLVSAREQGAHWLVAYLFRPFFREDVDTLEMAQRLGFSVAVFTDHRYKYTESLADFTSTVPVGSKFTFPPMVAPFLVTATLLELMLEEFGPEGRQRMTAAGQLAAAHEIVL